MRTVCVILGGGRGTRLAPLTSARAKPAVPLAGKYRLIDIPLSNCINSGLEHIFVLTQFLSASLNAHITRTYRFDMFSSGKVEVLAAEQTGPGGGDGWYQGTADAVRKQLARICRSDVDDVLILSGDHLYRADYQRLLRTHRETRADVTVSVLPVSRRDCTGFGVLAMDGAGRVVDFTEKPSIDEDITRMRVPASRRAELGEREYLASMGVYAFRREALEQALSDPAAIDFGKDILPGMIRSHEVAAHLFEDYWEDIGTIRAFFEANLRLVGEDAPFRFYVPSAPIYTRPRFLPPSIVHDTHLEDVLLSDGCLIDGAELRRAVVGIRSRISGGARISRTVLMGADYYEDEDRRAENVARGRPDVGIGTGTVIEQAIIDKNARIGPGCTIRGRDGRPDEHREHWSIVDGIVIVPKNAVLPEGTVI